MDSSGRVIYMGAFSKVLFPSLRLGYLVLPRSLVDVFAAARAWSDWHSPTLEQAASSRPGCCWASQASMMRQSNAASDGLLLP